MILCLGLTPTVQRTQRFARLVLGEVNRAQETITTASGKAVNVARVLDTLGARVCLIQPLGGDSGRWIAKSLSFSQEIVWASDDAPTRTCCTLLSGTGESATELVEEAAPLTETDRERLFQITCQKLVGASALALSGSLPPGTPTDFYARLCRESPVPVFLDAQKEPLRRALAEGPFLVKPNRLETIAALGLSETTAALECARALCAAGAQNALVSDGKVGAVLVTVTAAWRIVPPPIVALNPIGSGDSLLAGLIWATLQRQTLVEAACYGTACAAANCLTPTSGVIEPEIVNQLRPQVVLEPVQ